jgi:hypothetical protein
MSCYRKKLLIFFKNINKSIFISIQKNEILKSKAFFLEIDWAAARNTSILVSSGFQK